MWQLDRPLLACPLLALWSWAGAAEQKRSMSGRPRSFYGGETGPGLSSTVTLFQGRYHFSPSHPLKIAATLQRQRQSRQDAARAFIFKCSLWPSKSNNGDILMDALPKIKTRSRVFLTLARVERQIKGWILNFMHLYSAFHRRQILGITADHPFKTNSGRVAKKTKTSIIYKHKENHVLTVT